MEKIKISRTIWILGFVSLFMDISSEIVHSLLPVFLTTVLAATYTQVGFIDGVGSGLTLFFKVISGPLSDYLRNKKYLVIIGYLMGALAKPLFALSQSVSMVLVSHSIDRTGKGIRGAPRDALIADITHQPVRGKAYGLRQTLDNVGAVIGPLLAIVLLKLLNDDLRLIFWVAVIPGLIAVALVLFGIEEPKVNSISRTQFRWKQFKEFKAPFWNACGIGALLQLARLGDAFLILRARDFGITLRMIPFVLITMNIVYSLVSYPAGVWSDQIGRRKVIMVGFGILVIASTVLAITSNLGLVFLGVGFWGVLMGLTQSNLIALVTDTCPENLRGTALGVFNLFSAVTMVIGSTVAGILWDHYGAPSAFFAAGSVAMIGLLIFGFPKKE